MPLKDNLDIRFPKFCSVARKDRSSIRGKAVTIALSFAAIHQFKQSLLLTVTIKKRLFKPFTRSFMSLFQKLQFQKEVQHSYSKKPKNILFGGFIQGNIENFSILFFYYYYQQQQYIKKAKESFGLVLFCCFSTKSKSSPVYPMGWANIITFCVCHDLKKCVKS